MTDDNDIDINGCGSASEGPQPRRYCDLPLGHDEPHHADQYWTGETSPVEHDEPYSPPHLAALVNSITYKPGWSFYLNREFDPDGSGGLAFHVISDTIDSFNFETRTRVNHTFLVPPASYNRDVWAAWLFDRIRDVETHEAGEFFRLDGVREFAPHHSNGEDPYRVWHVSDWSTANKSSGQA